MNRRRRKAVHGFRGRYHGNTGGDNAESAHVENIAHATKQQRSKRKTNTTSSLDTEKKKTTWKDALDILKIMDTPKQGNAIA